MGVIGSIAMGPILTEKLDQGLLCFDKNCKNKSEAVGRKGLNNKYVKYDNVYCANIVQAGTHIV